MSRKDYEMIAKTMRATRNLNSPSQWEVDVMALSATFAENNPRFDDQKFLAACGVAKGLA